MVDQDLQKNPFAKNENVTPIEKKKKKGHTQKKNKLATNINDPGVKGNIPKIDQNGNIVARNRGIAPVEGEELEKNMLDQDG